MGSLVAGWDSPTSNSGKGRFERNKSLTNEGIETFWKLKRQVEEEHLEAVAKAQAQGHATSDFEFPTHDNIKVSEAVLTRGATHPKLAANRPTGLDTSRSFPAYNSRSFPAYNTTTVAADSQLTKDDLDNLRNGKAWWTRSNWAFLNEPPVMATEGSAHKYATQYHVSGPGSTQRH